MPLAQIQIPEAKIEELCRRNGIRRLALFGSVLSDRFSDSSDIDVLVSFAAGTRISLFTLVRMEEDLKGLLGRDVDLVERQAIEESPNWIRREAILRSAHVVYAAA